MSAAARSARPGFCPVMRRMQVRISSLNISTGDIGLERVEVQEKPCGSPLFTNEYERGICKSCARGWETLTNYPTEEGRAAISAALLAEREKGGAK